VTDEGLHAVVFYSFLCGFPVVMLALYVVVLRNRRRKGPPR
jgi:hypothetical protein